MAISIQPTREAEGLELNQFGAAASNQVYYQVIGANNETEASLALYNYVPRAYAGMYLSGVRVIEYVNNTFYRVAAIYSNQSPGFSGSGNGMNYDDQPEIHMTIGQTTTHLDYAYQRVWLSDGAPAELQTNLGINMDTSYKPAGVDTTLGTQGMQVVIWKPVSYLTAAFSKRLKSMAGTVNNAKFLGFEAGELKFDGADYSYRPGQNEPVRIAYQFSIEANTDNFQMDTYFAPKRGWDYAHYFWGNFNVGGQLQQAPIAAIIDRVYPYTDFRKLGITGV